MQQVTVWISSDDLGSLTSEADRRYPLETGGVLIGYWSDLNTVVVTASVGPGPASVHSRRTYQHDHAWESSRIAFHYEKSGRSEVYLGDWHTHPNASNAHLSSMDRRSMRQVIRSPEARVTRPLMCILFGKPSDWRLSAQVGELKKQWRWIPKLVVCPIAIREYA
jgi:integrative and conjugative element protein (TIGR02256 family)